MKIITTDLNQITLSSQFLILRSPNGEIEVDIKKLLKEPINSDNAYFNATQVASMYDKDIASYMKSTGKDYMKIIRDRYSNLEPDSKLKTHFTKRGRYHSGTWLHSLIFLDFCRWLDKSFAVDMDLMMKEIIIHSNELKIERDNSRFHFKGLTDIIKDKYITAQISDNGKKYAYSTLSTLINVKALGCKASKYIKDMNLDPDIPVRDQISKELVTKIDDLEQDLHGYIKYGDITDYEELKRLLK